MDFPVLSKTVPVDTMLQDVQRILSRLILTQRRTKMKRKAVTTMSVLILTKLEVLAGTAMA